MGLSPATSVSGGGGATELAYVEKTTNTTINVSDPTNSVEVLSAGAITFSGERICIEFYAPIVECANNDFINLNIWDGATRLGDIASFALTTQRDVPCLVRRFLTPTAGAHTYSIRGYRNSGNGTVYGGDGAIGNYAPAYIRITEE